MLKKTEGAINKEWTNPEKNLYISVQIEYN